MLALTPTKVSNNFRRVEQSANTTILYWFIHNSWDTLNFFSLCQNLKGYINQKFIRNWVYQIIIAYREYTSHSYLSLLNSPKIKNSNIVNVSCDYK